MHLKKAKTGDVSALNQLLVQYKDFAFSIAFRILKNEHDAEDVIQDSFIKVFKSIKQFRNESTFSTWLYRIVYNESIRVQKCKNQFLYLDIHENDAIVDYPIIYDALQNLLANERKKVIRKALDQLHANESLILTLYYLEDKNIKEIHKITQLSKSNIKVILHRARKNLHTILKRML
ncbi:RNA polymerase sigma factor [Candidatus Latescibacterota bacterium]